MTIGLSFASVFADDIGELSDFYRRVFGFDEVVELHSEHFRGLRVGGTVLGFSAHTAYDMLNLVAPERGRDGVSSFLTFEMADGDEVDTVTAAAIAAGGTCVKAPTRTYYGAWQSVFLDPEGNAFRINHLTL
ncbi:VOC family protein [Gordonia rubripertincta]|uniref:VOC family protein n=1 Tax=Gordonia rubripertincta TaxID=36822 RepID=A0ABT4N3Y1_GORRU|nr:VOC family protein [Gordonia rubripertincta]MCZ4553937.1 VOC family protein [Gordonia rubripertincta]